MKECLHCKKEFEEKRESAKFCSTSCRVMYNRKHGKKERLVFKNPKEVMDRLSALDAKLDKIIYASPTPESYDGARLPKGFVDDEPLSFDKLKEEVAIPSGKTAEQFKAAKLACESQEEWESLKKEIMESSLPKWLKESIIKYN